MGSKFNFTDCKIGNVIDGAKSVTQTLDFAGNRKNQRHGLVNNVIYNEESCGAGASAAKPDAKTSEDSTDTVVDLSKHYFQLKISLKKILKKDEELLDFKEILNSEKSMDYLSDYMDSDTTAHKVLDRLEQSQKISDVNVTPLLELLESALEVYEEDSWCGKMVIELRAYKKLYDKQ